MLKIKPYVPNRIIFELAEKRFGIHIEERELVIDDDAVALALALGVPEGGPPMLEDPVERKKAFIEHMKRLYGSSRATFTGARKHASISLSSEPEAVHNIPSSSAEPCSGGLL